MQILKQMTFIVMVGLKFNYMKKNKILVTGGSGMVGRSLKKILPNAIYLSSKDCNLINKLEVEVLLSKYNPDIIIHLAAKVGGIIDNIHKPSDYYEENILINTNILRIARIHGVKRFIGLLSTCIYPDKMSNYPMTEDMLHDGAPTLTNFSYGISKRSLAVQIDASNKQYNTKYQYLIPCNLYGEYDKWGENSHFVAALIKKIAKAKNNNETEIELFGTGKPLRQFMHSDDLAIIIKKCIDDNIYDNFNVATSQNISIKEIAKIALKACDATNLSIKFDMDKPDGQFRKDVSIAKLSRLIPDFTPIDLYDGIKSVYKKVKF